MKIKCDFCQVEQTIKVSDLKVKKNNKEYFKAISDKEELVQKEYKEFLKEREKINPVKSFFKCFSFDYAYYCVKKNDFDDWLFAKKRVIWRLKCDVDNYFEKARYWECKICKMKHLINKIGKKPGKICWLI